jgi:hypothetical protein
LSVSALMGSFDGGQVMSADNREYRQSWVN